MRVAAGFGVFLLLSGLPALAQTAAPRPYDHATRKKSFGVAGMEGLHPDAASFTCETTTEPGKPSATVCKTAMAPACPLDMHVRQGIGGGMIAVDSNGVKRKVFAPRLRLFLNDIRPDKSGQRIVSATVKVHGSNGKERILPLISSPDSNLSNSAVDRDANPDEIERTLTVNLGAWGEPGVSGDFRLPGFTSTSRVDLQSVTYEDGSTWKVSGRETCHVAPDFLMRIGN